MGHKHSLVGRGSRTSCAHGPQTVASEAGIAYVLRPWATNDRGGRGSGEIEVALRRAVLLNVSSYVGFGLHVRGPLAQLAEQRTFNPWVVGSSPTGPTPYRSSAHDEALVDQFAAALATALPWVAFLPDPDRETFAAEAADTLRPCASIGRFTTFADLIDDWRTTAEIWSDPGLAAPLAAEVSTPLD